MIASEIIPTAAIITRTHLIEGPYLNEFIQWYLNIGVQHIYFINTEPHNRTKLESFIDPIFVKDITIIDHSGGVNEFSYAYNVFNNNIKQDYVLHIDSDEFLILPKTFTNIGQFISTHKYDLYSFYWCIVCINKLYQKYMFDYLEDPTARYKMAESRKMMVNRLTWLQDPNRKMAMHYFSCKGTIINFKNFATIGKIDGSEPFILHFSVRGHLHTLLKIKHQRLGKSSKVGLDLLLNKCDPTFRELPMRFQIQVADTYSSLHEIPYDKWNIPSLLSTYKNIIKDDLFDKTDDSANLHIKIQKNIEKLKQINMPINFASGIRYRLMCLQHLTHAQ